MQQNTTTVPVHIFNPHGKPFVIRQDLVVGQAEPVKVEHAITKHESPSEVGVDCSKMCNPKREKSTRG